MKRVRYPAEFKGEAVKEVTERGHGVVDVAKMLPPTPSSQVFSNCAEPPMTPICVPCAAQNLVFPGKWSCQSRIGKHCHESIGVNSRGVQTVAEQAHLNPTQLSRTLSPKGNPALNSLLAILKAMGLRLAVQPLVISAHATSGK